MHPRKATPPCSSIPGAALRWLSLWMPFLLIGSAVFQIIFLYSSQGSTDVLSQASAPLWHAPNRLTLIVLDGVPRDILKNADHYPTIARLASQGYLVGKHRTPEGFTATAPVVFAMGTGAPSTPTQLLRNFSAEAFEGDSIFRVLRRSGRTSAIFGEKIWSDLFGPHLDHVYVHADHGLTDLFEGDRQTLKSALEHGGEADLSVIHFTGSDHAGHRYDFGDPAYREVSRSLDRSIAAILEAFPDRHVFITADHGMSRDRSHVSPEPDVVEPPFLCFSPLCPRNEPPVLDTVQIATLMNAFLGVGPPATATEPPPRGLLALGPEQEAAYRKAFHEEVILRRPGVDPGTPAPSTWEELEAQNQATRKQSLRAPVAVHAQALAFLVAGLIGAALYRPGLRRSWLPFPIFLASWLTSGPLAAALLLMAALTLLATEFEALHLHGAQLVNVAPAQATLAFVCLPVALLDGRIDRESLARFAPLAIACGLLVIAMLALLRRRSSPWPTVAITLFWSMLFLAHLWPRGAATYAATGLSIGGVAWLARKTGPHRRTLAGVALTAAAWIPFYSAGGAPTQIHDLGSGLHAVPESFFLRGVAAAIFAGFILWLCAQRRDIEMLTAGALALQAPVLAATHTGFAIEAVALVIYLVILVRQGSREARLAAAAASLMLLSSSAQVIGVVTIAWAFALLSPSLRRVNGAAGDHLAGVLLATCLYVLGTTFHVGRVENALPNPDLIAPGLFWVAITVTLIFLKVILVAGLLLLNWTPAKCLESLLLRLALLSVVPVALLHDQGYAARALAMTPVILLFAATVLFGRLVLILPVAIRTASRRSRLPEDRPDRYPSVVRNQA